MLLSNFFLPILKENPKEAEIASHILMLRSGMIQQSSSGIYSWLPLGKIILDKITAICNAEMINAGSNEILMPTLQSAELWKESGRYEDYGKEMLRIVDRNQRDLLYGPTNEELVTEIFRTHIKSYKELPLILFHSQWKFRDELRPRFGVMRGREFLMKDAYSFHENEECLDKTYQTIFEAYKNCFDKIGFEYKVVNADNGQIGGSESHEFHVIAENGEDELIFSDSSDYAINSELFTEPPKEGDDCPDGAGKVKIKRGIEVGHIFKLGKNYSESMNASISNKENKNVKMTMGCYGIGVSRIAAAAIEQSNDEKGIIWPKSISPFEISIISIGYTKNNIIKNYTDSIYKELKDKNVEVLLDDRDISPGNMFSDSDLIGIPLRITIGKQFLENYNFELKDRKNSKTYTISENNNAEKPTKEAMDNVFNLINR